MKIPKKRISTVLQQVIGDPDAEKIIFYLKDKSNISEFIIAEELDLEIHRTRKLLYRLLDSNIVSFKRKKDKIKGWYICYWDFNESAIPHLEEKYRQEEIEKIRERLNTEQGGIFYMCRYAHVRLGFEESFEQNFKCPECGQLMNQLDNERTISFLENKLTALEAEQAEYEASLLPKKIASPSKPKATAKPKVVTKKKAATKAKPKATPKKKAATKATTKAKTTTKKKAATKATTKRKVASKTKTKTVAKKVGTAKSSRRTTASAKTATAAKTLARKSAVRA